MEHVLKTSNCPAVSFNQNVASSVNWLLRHSAHLKTITMKLLRGDKQQQQHHAVGMQHKGD